jgi:PWWP domain
MPPPRVGQLVWVALPEQIKWPAIVWDKRFACAEELAEAIDFSGTHCLVSYFDDEHLERERQLVPFWKAKQFFLQCDFVVLLSAAR